MASRGISAGAPCVGRDRPADDQPTKAGLTGGLPGVVQGLAAGLRFRAFPGLLIFQFSDRGSTP